MKISNFFKISAIKLLKKDYHSETISPDYRTFSNISITEKCRINCNVLKCLEKNSLGIM